MTANLSIKLGNSNFKLQSIVEHIGDAESGHYINYSNRGNWYLMNDSLVSKVEEKKIVNA